MFHTLDATHVPVSRSNGERSGSPDSLVPTHMWHVVCHIFLMARPMNFKLGIRMEDDDSHQPQAPWPPRSNYKVAKSRDQSEPYWPINRKRIVVVSSKLTGGYLMTLATLRTSFKVKGQGHRPTNADTQICAYLLIKSWCADGGCRPASVASAVQV